MSYTQFTLTLFIRGFFLRQNQSWLSYTVTVLVALRIHAEFKADFENARTKIYNLIKIVAQIIQINNFVGRARKKNNYLLCAKISSVHTFRSHPRL